MNTLYFKVQQKNEAIPLFRTIKEVGNYNTMLDGTASPGKVYIIKYEKTSFAIININMCDEAPLVVTCKDLSNCPFIHLPIELQKEMVSRSVSKSVIPFLRNITASELDGGFDWYKTPEKYDFWSDIILREQLDLFFKPKKCKENIKSSNLKQQQNENENQLQKEGIPQSGGNKSRETGILCRGHKAKITIGHLSNQARLGRG